MADAQQRAQAVLDDLTGSGHECGLQVAAYLEGKLVVDAWSGIAVAETGQPVDGETLFTVFSCTKGITATVVHLLADRGHLYYDDPITRYWPEFGARGKESVTVRQALTHTAGIPQMPDGVTPEDMCDWDGMCRAIADLEPLWPPGTRTGYHGLTYGWILGEVVRRVHSRPIAQVVQEEICRPLGIDSLFFGIPDAVEPRVAALENGPAPETPPLPDSLRLRALPPAVTPSRRVYNRPDVRRASIPGAGGIMNARALAGHYAALAGADPAGMSLLSPERLKLATTLQTQEVDLAIGEPVRKGLGYFLGGPLSAMGDRITAFGHPGAGGSIGFADPEHRFAFALTKNRLIWTDPPGETAACLVAREVRAALGIPEAG